MVLFCQPYLTGKTKPPSGGADLAVCGGGAPRPAAAARQLRSLGDGGRLPPKGPPAARRTRAATYLNNQLRLQPNYFNFNFFILNLVFVILNFFFNSAS